MTNDQEPISSHNPVASWARVLSRCSKRMPDAADGYNTGQQPVGGTGPSNAVSAASSLRKTRGDCCGLFD